MATLNQDLEKDPNQQPTTGGTTAAPTGSGQGVAGQNQMTPGVSGVQQNQAPTGSGYTDVGTYLDANKSGSADLGNRVASNLINKYNQTKTGADESYNQFAGNVNQGYTQENIDLINQVAADPTAAASNADTLANYQKQLNDTYTGPQNWSDFGTQQGKVNEATQYGSLANTPGGLNVYAQEAEGQTGGPQSQGINQLDTLLLGGSPEAMGQVQAAADPYKTLNDYINQQNTAGTGLVNTATTNAQNASQHALDAFTGANGTLTNLNTGINSATQKALADAQANQEAIKTGLASKNLTDADLKNLGLNSDQWNTLKAALTRANTSQYMTGHNFGAASGTQDIDLLQGLQQQDPTQMINAGTVATPEQYQQMAAIQQLLGGKNPEGNAINPALASLAGTYDPSSLNQFDYSGALNYAIQVGDQERQAAQDEANRLTAEADLKHAQSKHGHGLLGGLKEALTHPGNTIGSVFNPTSWGANAQNILKGQGPNPVNEDPFHPKP